MKEHIPTWGQISGAILGHCNMRDEEEIQILAKMVSIFLTSRFTPVDLEILKTLQNI